MTKEGGDRPQLTSIPGGKLPSGELSRARRGEIAGRQAVAFLNRFNAFRGAHPINTDLTPASQTYHSLEAFRGNVVLEGDEEASRIANRVTRGLFVHAFTQFSEEDKVLVAQDYGIARGLFARSMNQTELGISLDASDGIIFQTLLSELDIPFTPNPVATHLSFTRFIWEMRKVAVENHLIDHDEPEGEFTLSEPPSNVTSIEGRTPRRNR